MAKLSLAVTLRKNDGTAISQVLQSGNKDTFTEAKAALQAQITPIVNAATQNAQDLQDAQAAFDL